MKKIDVCSWCGRREDEHHPFSPISIPDGCVCVATLRDVKDFGLQGQEVENVPEACKEFVVAEAPSWRRQGLAAAIAPDEFCVNCKHMEACHRP